MPYTNAALLLGTPNGSADTTLSSDRDDDTLLVGDGGGVLYDFDALYTYTGSSPIPTGTASKNIANDGKGGVAADGTLVSASGQSVGFAGGGLDFSTLTAVSSGQSNGLLLPAGVSSALSGSPHGYVSLFMVVRPPTKANWNAGATTLPFLTFATAAGGATSSPDLITIGMRTSGGVQQIVSQRQLTYAAGVGTVEAFTALSLGSSDAAFNGVCGIHYYRNAVRQKLTLYRPDGTVLAATAATGADNTGDYSATQALFGVNNNRYTTALIGAGSANWRGYRLWIARPDIDLRDPDTVAANDWAQIVAANQFS